MKTSKTEYNSDFKNNRGRQLDGSPNQIDIYIGKRLLLRRKALKMSQNTLGKKMGISFQQVQKYEKGQNRISASRLYDFATLLGVDTNYFYQDMPQEISNKSPRFIVSSNKYDNISADFIASKDPLKSSHIQELVNNFIRLPNNHVADSLFDLIAALISSQSASDKKK